jgi:hypothetical protein
MNRQNQSPRDSMVGINSGNAFRAQAIRAIADIPVVMSVGFAGGSGRMKAVRTPHWLSRSVTCPAATTAASRPSATDNRWAKHIADLSSRLPADCANVMVSRGRVRT